MSDALQDSINEVNTIAHGLQELQQRIHAYGQASQKLTNVSSDLGALCGHIQNIQLAFTQMTIQAEQTQNTIRQGTGIVEAMIAEIPHIVERIEKADIFSQIAEFNSHLEVLKHTLTAQKKTLEGAFDDLQQERQQHVQHLTLLLKKAENFEQGLERLHANNNQQMQLLHLINQVSTQNIAAPIVQQTQVLLDIKNLSAQHYQHDQTQDTIAQKKLNELSKQLSELDKQFKHSQQKIEAQEQHLDVLSKRRGFIF
ncbi:MAG: hypothetical protein IPP76_09520 [Moraxellaceae bacterium]|nr:hypothetical protein [Moraxellaceae bacterium]